MERQHAYNLRPRKSATRNSLPKPSIGDRVSVFWDSLDKDYEGTLTKFDPQYTTFLVEYDDTPDGYDDNRIWEDLDCVHWRFLNRFEQRKLRSTEKHVRRCRNHGDDGTLLVRWFEPGELSVAHPQFARSYRRKKTKMKGELCVDGRATPEEDKGEDMDLESEEYVNKSEDGNEGNNRELSVLSDDHGSQKEEPRTTNVIDTLRRENNAPHRRKRKYANFGAVGFNATQKDLLPDFAQTNGYTSSYLYLAQDAVRVNCSRDESMESPQRHGGSNETNQGDSFFVRTGHRVVHSCINGGNSNSPRTDEEQIRSITRSMGLSKESRYMLNIPEDD